MMNTQPFLDNTRIVNLYFRQKTTYMPILLHAGSEIKGIDKVSHVIHSDTLFSAICHAWNAIYGRVELEDLLDKFQNEPEPPFRLSSAFPVGFRAPVGRLFFVPRPFTDFPGQKSKDIGTTFYFNQY